MSYMEDNYQLPDSQSKYLKLQEGVNKFRILSKSISGRIDWDKRDKKPKPVRTKEKPVKDFDKEKPSKHFWAFCVWDYGDDAVKILEITQKSIQKIMYGLFTSDERGDPRAYDLKIDKQGTGMDTEYSCSPLPPKPISKEITKLYEELNIHLELLFEGEDPFDYKGYSEKKVENDEVF